MPGWFKVGVLYFMAVFAVGFVLGPVRVLWAAPRFGERTAELLEAPFMLGAILLAARWAARRLPEPRARLAAAAAGATAVGLLLVAESLVAVVLRGVSVSEYISERDPVSGVVYLALIATFGVMPWLMVRSIQRRGLTRCDS